MKVYFIGAGPGDPELLTLKAAKIIRRADIIIYAGSLVNKGILKSSRKRAHLYDSSGMCLEEILKIIKNEISTNKLIARIHSGEPSIYGAIQEQIDWCQKENIDCEVIPGISSFQQAAASLKQELTLPGVSQTVILTRSTGKTKVPKREDLEKLARSKSTLVIFLSVQKISQVIARLKKSYGLINGINNTLFVKDINNCKINSFNHFFNFSSNCNLVLVKEQNQAYNIIPFIFDWIGFLKIIVLLFILYVIYRIIKHYAVKSFDF